jgi:hypothetical protein
MRKRHSPQTYMHHIELISKLRHCHLVSALGHCFECNQDDSSVSRIFLIFEFVPNGTLRGCISGKVSTHCILLPVIMKILNLVRDDSHVHQFLHEPYSYTLESFAIKFLIKYSTLKPWHSCILTFNTWFNRTSQTQIYLDTENSSCNWSCEGYSISAHRDCSGGIFK